MIVGTQSTGEGRNGPDPSGFGTHDGTMIFEPPPGGTHWIRLLLSHPHVSGPGTSGFSAGFPFTKPSRFPLARMKCEPQDGPASLSNVRSWTT